MKTFLSLTLHCDSRERVHHWTTCPRTCIPVLSRFTHPKKSVSIRYSFFIVCFFRVLFVKMEPGFFFAAFRNDSRNQGVPPHVHSCPNVLALDMLPLPMTHGSGQPLEMSADPSKRAFQDSRVHKLSRLSFSTTT